MPPAPWDGASSADQLFVLVTGANSGIGLGICQRLIDEFVAAHPGPGAHLALIVTTRSPSKARATRVALRQHLARRVAAAARKTRTGTPTDLHPGRIHVAGLELDLCCLPSVYAAADRLVHGTVDVFSGIDDGPQHNDNSFVSARIPRLDSVVLNAGIGGFTGMHWGRFAWNVLTAGFVQATTYPQFKMAQRGLRVDPLTGRYVSAAADAHEQPEQGLEDRTLGAVFCANVFGHYVLVHALLPLLRRSTVDDHHDVLPPPPPARVIWESSVESVCWRYLAPDDLQGLCTDAPGGRGGQGVLGGGDGR
ncbi:3-ketosteroid reductase [Niveomyces insectorum RCEF 264]|uniref:3-ketosteroid reductase n=1 Tax=Niveomyces insectorum RCEF 264 TaxID=1081102 RepID=A0A167LDF4_9HYPO|nr:3-ketosteroid reductase [Niveomyces insectorum RCEF 264]